MIKVGLFFDVVAKAETPCQLLTLRMLFTQKKESTKCSFQDVYSFPSYSYSNLFPPKIIQLEGKKEII
jgi:hypothetical protein